MARNSSFFQTLDDDDDKKKKRRAIDLIGGSSEVDAYQKRIFNRERADTFKAEDDAKINKTKNRFGNLKERLGMSLSKRFGKQDDTTELKSIGESIKEIPSKQGFLLEARDKMDQKSRQKKMAEANNAWQDTFLDVEQAKKDLDDEIIRLQGSIASQGQPLRDMGKPLTLQEETKQAEKKVSLMGGKDQLTNKGQVGRGTFQGDVATTQRQAELLEESKESLQLLREYSKEVETKGGFLSGVTSAMKDGRDAAKTFIPFAGDIFSTLETVHDAKEINKVQTKLANGESLTISEKTFYKRYQNEILSEMIKRGVAYDIGKTIASLPKYALEFAITGGIATGITKGLGRVGAKSALTKTLETASKEGVKKTIGSVTRKEAKEIGVDLVRSSIANAGRTGIGFSPTISRKTAEYMSDDMAIVQGANGDMIVKKVGEGDSFWKALVKAFATTYVEVGAESTGLLAEVPMASAKRGVMKILGKHIAEPDKFIQKAILGKFAAKRGIVSADDLSKIAEKIGWNGVVAEVFEEELTELAQAPIEERQYYAPWTPQGLERLFVESMAIGAFGGLGAIAKAPLPAGRIDTTGGRREEETVDTTEKPIDNDMVFDLEKEGIEVKDKGQEQPIEQLDEGNTTIEEQVLPQEGVTEDTQEAEPTKDGLNEVLKPNEIEEPMSGGYIDEDKGAGEYTIAVKDVQQNTGEKMVRGNINIDKLEATQTTTDMERLDRVRKEIASGARYPIVVEFQPPNFYDVVDGNTRLSVYKEMGITDIPVVVNESGLLKQPVSKQDPLIEEARKYKSAEEFVKAQFSKKPQYGMGHRPSYDGMPSSHNLLDGDALPKDVYEHPEWSIASGRNLKTDTDARQSWEALQKVRNNPDMEVNVYRAGAKDELNIGDWVTFSEDYAKQSLEGTETVHSFKVKAKDVVFAGDDINEFGYYPKSQLIDIWNKANKTEDIVIVQPTSKTSKARPSESQIGQIYTELDSSEAGERFRTAEGDWIGKNSTFPDWITSPDLRDRGVIDKVLGYLRSGKEPPERFGKIRALYDMALEEAQTREADVEADKEIEQDKKDALKKKKANEIKVGDVSTSKDRKIATTKPIEAKGKVRESRAFQNVKERLQDATEDDPTYNQMDLADNAVKAVEFVRKYPKRAEKISMGMELPPSGMTQTAITLAYSEALGLTGKHAKRVQIEKVLSLTMTRLGQEIVSLRGRINTDSSPYFIQKVLEARKNLLASGWKLPSYVQKIGGKPIETNAKKVAIKISEDAKSLKSKIDAKVLEDLGSAQAFIDSITC